MLFYIQDSKKFIPEETEDNGHTAEAKIPILDPNITTGTDTSRDALRHSPGS